MNINNNVVYRIFSENPKITECYIGSTRNLKRRKATHIHLSKFNNNKLYHYIRQYGLHNFKFEVLASIGEYKKAALIGLERIYYNQFLPTLNMNIPCQTVKQWQQKNKNKMAVNMNRWRLENRQKINILASKKYNDNKEVIKKKNLEYYHLNKEKIKHKNNYLCYCLCGSSFRYKNKKLHLNSIEHHQHLLINIIQGKNSII